MTPANRGTSSTFVEFQGKLVLRSSGVASSLLTAGLVTWDGTKFEALPALNDYVDAVGVWNDHLIAATNGYNPTRFAILQLNGAVWDTLGKPNNYVWKFGEFQNHLIAGGRFTAVNGVPCSRVAAFDGTSWSNAGTGISGTEVTGLTVHQGKLVAGGTIAPAPGVVSLDALGGAWQPVGGGFGGTVKDVLSDGVELYVSGAIWNSSLTTRIGSFMHWNGTTWLGTGSPTSGVSDVYMTRWNSKVVVNVTAPGSVGRLAQWDGVALTPVPGDSLNSIAFGIGTWGTKLVATGNGLSRNGSAVVPGIVTYDGSQWGTIQEPWGPGMYGTTGDFTDMRSWGGRLIVSGPFNVVADQDHWANDVGIAAWDGAHWSPLGNGLAGQYIFLGEYAGDLIAFGYTVSARGLPISHVARWNGTSWSGFGTNAPDYSTSAAEFQAQLYVASDNAGGLWCWNGSTWVEVPGLESQYVEAVGTAGGRLVVGGIFPQAGAATSPNVAFWDGTTWAAAGAGVNDLVYSVAEWLGQPVIGGAFTASGGTSLPGVAIWDGSQWQPMGTNAVEVVRLRVIDGELFATGRFRLPDNSVAGTIAHWTGTDWHVLGSGGGDYPWPLASFGGYLYEAGSGQVHGHPAHGLSRVPLSAVLDVPRAGPHAPTLALTASPNPSRGRTAFAFTLPSAGHARLTVVDLAGRIVATLADGAFDAGTHQVRWSAGAPAGVYFARLEIPGGSRVTRVVRFE